MTCFELERQLTRKTGESLGTIRRRGFSLVRMQAPASLAEEDLGPQVLDWDQRRPVRLYDTLVEVAGDA